MYKQYFGFQDIPFSIAPDPRYLYLSDRHREALAHLIYGVGDQGGFVLLTGEVGTGKTTICRSLLQQLPDKTDVAYIINPKQSVNQLLKSIAEDFSIHFDSADNNKDLIDHLNAYLLHSHSEGRNAVLIIDEAQNLSVDVLEQLRLLTNLETNEKKLLQLVLLGQPELNDLLSRGDLRQLEQRITARFHLNPLSKNEVAYYIEHRLSVAGCREQLFTPSAISKIYQSSQGIPRLINKICDRSLLGVYSSDQDKVSTKIVANAIKELFPDKKGAIRLPSLPKAFAASVVFVCLVVASAVYFSDDLNVSPVKQQMKVADSLLKTELPTVVPAVEPLQTVTNNTVLISPGDEGDSVIALQQLLLAADIRFANDLLLEKPDKGLAYVAELGKPSKLGRLYAHELHFPDTQFTGVYSVGMQRVVEKMQKQLQLPVKQEVDQPFLSQLKAYVDSIKQPLIAAMNERSGQ